MDHRCLEPARAAMACKVSWASATNLSPARLHLRIGGHVGLPGQGIFDGPPG